MNTKLFYTRDKKLLIGSNLSFIDEYLKSLVRKEKKPILNIEKATINNLAKQIVATHLCDKDITFISSKEAQALMHSFLMKEKDEDLIYGLIPNVSFSLKTSSMVYDVLIQVRNGRVIKRSKVDKLIDDFEQYLLSNNLYDDSLTLKTANKLLNKLSSDEIKLYLNMNTISLFVFNELNEKLNYQQSLFISSLEKVFNVKKEIINLSEENPCVNKIKVNAYGFANEINYIVNAIKENNLNLDDVAIYVSDDTYTNLIQGAFEVQKINYNFNYSIPALNNEVITFIKSVLDFYIYHFPIKALHNIYMNVAFIKKETKDISFLKDLRSDKEQILYNVNHSFMSDTQKDFLKDLLSLDESFDVIDIYRWLIDFVKRNIDANYFEFIKDELNSLNRYFTFVNISHLSFEDKLDFIKQSILSLKIKQSHYNDNESYVEIYKLKSSIYLSRKHNFIVGLSARQFQIKETDFPLVNDQDLKECLDSSYYIRYVSLMNLELIDNVNKLINTLSCGDIYFIKSEYDSNEFKSLSPSAFYLDLKAKEDEKTYNAYKDDKFISKPNKDIKTILYPTSKQDLILSSVNTLTPSRLETLLNCPIQYSYSLYMDDLANLFEYGDTWLSGAGDLGTIAHEILELYLIDHYQSLDKEYLNNIFNDMYEKYSTTLHFDQESKKRSEFAQIKDIVRKYLDRFYKSQENQPYHVLFTELEFNTKKMTKNKDIKLKDIEYVVDDIKCLFHGIIDRVDGYIDENNKLHLRFVDYKTTGKKSFENKEKNLKLSQAVIYPEIIPNLIKTYKTEIERKIGKHFIDVDLSDLTFVYELIMFNSESEFIYQKEKYLAQKEYIDESIRKLMNVISKNDFHLFMKEYDVEIEETNSDHDNSKCAYCQYSQYCPLKIELGGNKGWKIPKKE